MPIQERGSVRHLLELVDAIRPMPPTVRKLAQVIADEFGQLDDAADTVREDPLLVTSVLKEANSAASSPAVEIVEIDRAITRLGLARVLAIASLSVFGPEASQSLENYRMPAGALVTHSLRASYVAEVAFRLLDGAVGAGVVTAALLHDLGKIVLNMVLDGDEFERAIAGGALITTAERDLVMVDHAELGAMLLEAWGIPESIIEPVRYHHDPFSAPGPAALVLAASDLVVHQLTGFDEPGWDHDIGRDHDEELGAVLAGLGLDRRRLIDQSAEILGRSGLAVV